MSSIVSRTSMNQPPSPSGMCGPLRRVAQQLIARKFEDLPQRAEHQRHREAEQDHEQRPQLGDVRELAGEEQSHKATEIAERGVHREVPPPYAPVQPFHRPQKGGEEGEDDEDRPHRVPDLVAEDGAPGKGHQPQQRVARQHDEAPLQRPRGMAAEDDGDHRQEQDGGRREYEQAQRRKFAARARRTDR